MQSDAEHGRAARKKHPLGNKPYAYASYSCNPVNPLLYSAGLFGLPARERESERERERERKREKEKEKERGREDLSCNSSHAMPAHLMLDVETVSLLSNLHKPASLDPVRLLRL